LDHDVTQWMSVVNVCRQVAEVDPVQPARELDLAVDLKAPAGQLGARRWADGEDREVRHEVLAGRDPLGQFGIDGAATAEAAV